MSRQRDEQEAPRLDMEPVAIDLRLEGFAPHRSVVEGMNGVTATLDGSFLVIRITATTLREAQTTLDAALAALNEAESAS